MKYVPYRDVYLHRGNSSIWRLLAKECRGIAPLIPTSKALDLAIDRIINDISSGHDIRDFMKVKDEFAVRRSNGRGCSREMVRFLLLLRHQMATQGVMDIDPIRATELLFDFATAEHMHQNAVRLVEEKPGIFSFVTTYAAEEKYQECHRHLVPVRHSFPDWRALQTKRDKPAMPTLRGG